MQRKSFTVATAAAICAATAFLTSAGPLNPPPGAVSPTGRTLDEIYNAIGDLPTGDCGAAIPGRDRGDARATATGQLQGALPPIDVESYRANIERPYDPASGLPTGQLRLNPLTITKNTDSTTPLLMQAMANNEALTSVVLVLRDHTGAAHFEIRLQNATVISYTSGMIERCDSSHVQIEEFGLTYQRIFFKDLLTGAQTEIQRSF